MPCAPSDQRQKSSVRARYVRASSVIATGCCPAAELSRTVSATAAVSAAANSATAARKLIKLVGAGNHTIFGALSVSFPSVELDTTGDVTFDAAADISILKDFTNTACVKARPSLGWNLFPMPTRLMIAKAC